MEIEAIYSISHNCQREFCRKDRCCCSSYEVCIDTTELSTIIGCLPEAAKFSPHLNFGSGFQNVFEELGPNTFAIDTHEEGLCIFAYFVEDDSILCSLHSAALSLGLPPHKVKPKSCVLWPLSITEDYPIILSVDETALYFACNTPKNAYDSSLCSTIARIIRNVFGEPFLEKLRKKKPT